MPPIATHDLVLSTKPFPSKLKVSETETHWNNWPNEKGFDPEYEQRTPVELPVTGHIPAYAAGVLYRTGPGLSKVKADDGSTVNISHWFDGFTQLHRFQILAPDAEHPKLRVVYNSRFTTDALIEHARKTGSMSRLGFGQKRDPCKTIYNKFQTEYEPTGPSSRNVGVTLSVNMPGVEKDAESETSGGRWGNEKGIQNLYTKTDYNIFQKIDPETLEPIGFASQETLHPKLSGPMAASHARSDPVTGDVFNYNLTPGRESIYRVFRVSAATGETTILAEFPATPAYLHSLNISEDFVILCVWNSHLNLREIGKGSFKDAICPPDDSKPAMWYVIDRKHGRGLVATYETDAFFCFHTINAYQEPNKKDPRKMDIVADLVRSYNDSSQLLDLVLYDNLKSSNPVAKKLAAEKGDRFRTAFARFRLPALPIYPPSKPLKGSIEYSRQWQAVSPELPTMNPKYVTKKHRYMYALGFGRQATFTTHILKFDAVTKETMKWHEHGQSPGEPIFVPNPEAKSEDDGVLLIIVLDGHKDHSYLLCLDAKDLSELGRVKVDGVIGFGFHGQHVQDKGVATGDF